MRNKRKREQEKKKKNRREDRKQAYMAKTITLLGFVYKRHKVLNWYEKYKPAI